MSEHLQDSDLSRLCKELKKVTDPYSFGLYLKIPESELKRIEADHPSVRRRKQEVCAAFIRLNPNATWNVVVQALNEMGEKALASKIHEKYIGKPKPAKPSRQISDVSGSSCSSESGLGPSVSESELRNRCGCKPGCNMHQFCDVGCPKPDKCAVVPVLSKTASAATSLHDFHLEAQRQHETKQMTATFASFVDETCKSIKKKVSVIEFALWLMQLQAFYLVSHFSESMPLLLAQQINKIRRAVIMEEVFLILSNYWSWYNHALLEEIINKFGDEEDRRRLEVFKESFSTFAQNRIVEFSQHSMTFGAAVGDGKTRVSLVLKVDASWDSIHINQLAEIHRNVASILEVNPHTLYLATVRQGCILMKFLIPSSVAEAVFPLSASQQEALAAADIMLVKCGTHCHRFLKPQDTEADGSPQNDAVTTMMRTQYWSGVGTESAFDSESDEGSSGDLTSDDEAADSSSEQLSSDESCSTSDAEEKGSEEESDEGSSGNLTSDDNAADSSSEQLSSDDSSDKVACLFTDSQKLELPTHCCTASMDDLQVLSQGKMAMIQSEITVGPNRTTSSSSKEDALCSLEAAADINDSDLVHSNLTPGSAVPLQPRLEFAGGEDITLEMTPDHEGAESDQVNVVLTDTDKPRGRLSRQLQLSEAEELLENDQILSPIGHVMPRERQSPRCIDGFSTSPSPVIGKDKNEQKRKDDEWENILFKGISLYSLPTRFIVSDDDDSYSLCGISWHAPKVEQMYIQPLTQLTDTMKRYVHVVEEHMVMNLQRHSQDVPQMNKQLHCGLRKCVNDLEAMAMDLQRHSQDVPQMNRQRLTQLHRVLKECTEAMEKNLQRHSQDVPQMKKQLHCVLRKCVNDLEAMAMDLQRYALYVPQMYGQLLTHVPQLHHVLRKCVNDLEAMEMDLQSASLTQGHTSRIVKLYTSRFVGVWQKRCRRRGLPRTGFLENIDQADLLARRQSLPPLQSLKRSPLYSTSHDSESPSVSDTENQKLMNEEADVHIPEEQQELAPTPGGSFSPGVNKLIESFKHPTRAFRRSESTESGQGFSFWSQSLPACTCDSCTGTPTRGTPNMPLLQSLKRSPLYSTSHDSESPSVSDTENQKLMNEEADIHIPEEQQELAPTPGGSFSPGVNKLIESFKHPTRAFRRSESTESGQGFKFRQLRGQGLNSSAKTCTLDHTPKCDSRTSPPTRGTPIRGTPAQGTSRSNSVYSQKTAPETATCTSATASGILYSKLDGSETDTQASTNSENNSEAATSAYPESTLSINARGLNSSQSKSHKASHGQTIAEGEVVVADSTADVADTGTNADGYEADSESYAEDCESAGEEETLPDGFRFSSPCLQLKPQTSLPYLMVMTGNQRVVSVPSPTVRNRTKSSNKRQSGHPIPAVSSTRSSVASLLSHFENSSINSDVNQSETAHSGTSTPKLQIPFHIPRESEVEMYKSTDARSYFPASFEESLKELGGSTPSLPPFQKTFNEEQ